MACHVSFPPPCVLTHSHFLLTLFLCICDNPDVISIPKTNENFRLMYDVKGRYTVHKIDEAEAKVCFLYTHPFFLSFFLSFFSCVYMCALALFLCSSFVSPHL